MTKNYGRVGGPLLIIGVISECAHYAQRLANSMACAARNFYTAAPVIRSFKVMTLLLKARRSRPVQPLRPATQRRIMKTQPNGLRKPAAANWPYCVTKTALLSFAFLLPCIVRDLFLNNQPDAIIIQ